MKIVKVRYGRVVSMGQGTYETRRLELEAEVGKGESIDSVLAKLKQECNKRLGLVKVSDEEYQSAKKKIAQYEERKNIEDFYDYDDIPF